MFEGAPAVLICFHGGSRTLSRLLTGRTAAAVIAVAVSFAVSDSVAHAVPSAPARLAAAAQQTPHRQVVAIAQFKPGVSERAARALVRAHHGRVTDRLPAVNGFAVKLSARDARALRRDRRVLNLTLNTRVRSTESGSGSDGSGSGSGSSGSGSSGSGSSGSGSSGSGGAATAACRRTSRRASAPTRHGPPASPARASASRSSTPASTATSRTSRTPTALRASPPT